MAAAKPTGQDSQTGEFAAGTAAPVSGIYESANLFGSRTGHRVTIQQGETLPALPRGFSWVIAGPGSSASE